MKNVSRAVEKGLSERGKDSGVTDFFLLRSGWKRMA